MSHFARCRKCVTPERHPGCQETCRHYLEAKEKYEQEKHNREAILAAEDDFYVARFKNRKK